MSLPFSEYRVGGNLIFTSGKIGLTEEGKLVGESAEEQAHQTMKNLQKVLESAGVNFNDVVKTTIYITDMTEFPKINEIYLSYLKEPYPARETVAVKELAFDAKLEISMIAAK